MGISNSKFNESSASIAASSSNSSSQQQHGNSSSSRKGVIVGGVECSGGVLGVPVSGSKGGWKSSNCSNGNSSREPILSSTGGLQIVLQQHFLRENFRNFVSKHWCSSNKSDQNSNITVTERAFALNCIDFWTDLRDFNCITKSSFQVNILPL